MVTKHRRGIAVPARRPGLGLAHLAVAVGVVVLALAAGARRAYSHPLHTTLSEISVAPDGGLQIVMRAFVDDFAAAVAGGVPLPAAKTVTPHDSSAARYLASTLVLVDGAGKRVPLIVAGIRRSDDLVWVTLRVPSGRAPKGMRLTNRVLFERYDDQVNIVQANVGGRRQTLLFTKRDAAAAKAL